MIGFPSDTFWMILIRYNVLQTGFEFKKRRAFPVITGVIVAKENEAPLLEVRQRHFNTCYDIGGDTAATDIGNLSRRIGRQSVMRKRKEQLRDKRQLSNDGRSLYKDFEFERGSKNNMPTDKFPSSGCEWRWKTKTKSKMRYDLETYQDFQRC